ncbi:hypothetical protein ABT127_39120 [Streptomyces sp. NPDC001904]|uniref:hypothetical protein n=1 Tax=Streptomyces sp. NPDC001904 TaxID=3154531 RepID=UPI00331EEB0F
MPQAMKTPDMFVTVRQLPDGRVHEVDVSDEAPDIDSLCTGTVRKTVWAVSPRPGTAVDDDTALRAAKVWDAVRGPYYRHCDRAEWRSRGTQERQFHGASAERRTLRAVEAWLIRAGHLNVHTGVVAVQQFGLTATGPDAEVVVFRASDTVPWEYVVEFLDFWEPEKLAPAGASPRRVAAATLAALYRYRADRAQLHPLARLYLAADDVRQSTGRAVARWREKTRLRR